MTKTSGSTPRAFMVNNFDLIRLLAAAQVALHHSLSHLKIEHADWWITQITRYFPGVPVFFFVSGFLISRSYERQPDLLSYARNRLLRIYPALIVCTAVGILGAWQAGYFDTLRVGLGEFALWVVSQITVVQFHNPDFMRGYGVGVLNGSLWTISVELQFYVLIPIVYGFMNWKSDRPHPWLLPLLAIGFMFLNVAIIALENRVGETMAVKLIKISFVPWFYMFLVGMLFQRNFDTLRAHVEGRAVVYLGTYVLLAYTLNRFGGFVLGNSIGPLLFLPLAFAIAAAAYTWPTLSDTCLRRNDISYGVYIYHMPVVNYLLACGASSSFAWLASALAMTFGAAAISWFLVEKPCMKLKRFSIHATTPAPESNPISLEAAVPTGTEK